MNDSSPSHIPDYPDELIGQWFRDDTPDDRPEAGRYQPQFVALPCTRRHGASPWTKLGLVLLTVLIVGLGAAAWAIYPMVRSVQAGTQSAGDAVTATSQWLQDAVKREHQTAVERVVAGQYWKTSKLQVVEQPMTVDTQYCEGLGFTSVDQNCTPKSGVLGWLSRKVDSKSATVHMQGTVMVTYDMSRTTVARGPGDDSIVLTVPPPEYVARPDFDRTTYGDTSASLTSLLKDANAATAMGQAMTKMTEAAQADPKLAEASRQQLQQSLQSLARSMSGTDITVEVVVTRS